MKRPGCQKQVQRHAKGVSWTCRGCGKRACSSCAHHYWRTLGGRIEIQGGKPVFIGERVGTCAGCAEKGVLA